MFRPNLQSEQINKQSTYQDKSAFWLNERESRGLTVDTWIL